MKALLENHSLDCAVRRRSGETREFRSDQPRSASGRRRSDAELVSNQTSKEDQHTNLFHPSNARVASTHYVVRASNEAKIRTGQLHINPDWISDARNSKPRSEQDFKVDSQLKNLNEAPIRNLQCSCPKTAHQRRWVNAGNWEAVGCSPRTASNECNIKPMTASEQRAITAALLPTFL